MDKKTEDRLVKKIHEEFAVGLLRRWRSGLWNSNKRFYDDHKKLIRIALRKGYEQGLIHNPENVDSVKASKIMDGWIKEHDLHMRGCRLEGIVGEFERGGMTKETLCQILNSIASRMK